MSKNATDSCTPKAKNARAAHGAKSKAAIQVQAKQKGKRQTGGGRHIRSEKDASAAAPPQLQHCRERRVGVGTGERANSEGACLRSCLCAARETDQSGHPVLGIYGQKGQSTAVWKEAVRLSVI